MKRTMIVLGMLVLGLGSIAAILHVRGEQPQAADQKPHSYFECLSAAAKSECAQASQAVDDCRSGHVDDIGRFNCRQVVELHAACGQRAGESDDMTCRLFAHDYLDCIHDGHGAAACRAIEKTFLACLDGGRDDVPACKSARSRRMNCLSPKNLNKEHCRLLNEELGNETEGASRGTPSAARGARGAQPSI
ncbi:hypothetical protein [Nonomuraea antri]|uniref:hypothetical protein n=1 Tax=Nonomuraea antri TaxID=2730852 RepID=UPI001569FED6|nr:hypothetical protein [Nonomuraea antri]